MSNNTVHIHQTLIEKCRQRDTRAMNEVYSLYSKAMFHTSLRIVNDHHTAEDILQESFITAFRNIGSLRSEAGFGSWLKRIVINKSLNHVKKNKLVFSEYTEHMDVEEDKVESGLPDCTVEDIKSAMKQLPDGYRLIFTLYMFENQSHQEIAEKLNISVSTSKSQLHRCKNKLKGIILNSNDHGRRKA